MCREYFFFCWIDLSLPKMYIYWLTNNFYISFMKYFWVTKNVRLVTLFTIKTELFAEQNYVKTAPFSHEIIVFAICCYNNIMYT